MARDEQRLRPRAGIGPQPRTGKLGSAAWSRVTPAESHPSSDSLPAAAPARRYTATELYDYLSQHPFSGAIVDPPARIVRTETVEPDAREQSDGVLGIVRARVEASNDSGTISFVVFRDSAMADAAHDVLMIADSKRFRVKPGEYVSSHAYKHPEYGEARCLSRLQLHTSTIATITCYLPIRYPFREPVIMESEVSERVSDSDSEASTAAVQRGVELLFSGIKEWAIRFPTK